MKSLIAVLCVIGVTLAEQSSPLFMWNVDSVVKPALSTVPQNELVRLVSPYMEGNAMIVFVETKLTNRDLLCANEVTSKSCYARLQGIRGKNFYSSVNRPFETLRDLSDIRDYITVDQSGNLSSPLDIQKGKIMVVKFEDNLERSASLELHDSIMATITAQHEASNVIFAYTSEVSSSNPMTLSRERRATAASEDGFMFRSGAQMLVYFTSLFVIDSNDLKTEIKIDAMEVTETNKTSLAVNLKSAGSPITFSVTLSGGYFFMRNVKYGEVAFYSGEVYSPTDFSYFCGNLTLYSRGSAEAKPQMLKWNSFQFQAPFNSKTKEDFIFGEPWHCVGFFTTGILSGLLVVALLLSIAFVGVCWMMDINTMDRFDDPKGKTITINASD